MIFKKGPVLSPEEKKTPLAKYYDIPLTPVEPLRQQIIDACPIDPKLAIPIENMLDFLKPTGYEKVEYGYCMMKDGTGYLVNYTTYPNCSPEMIKWWLRWLNVYPKSIPKGHGNLKYKIWCPPGHYDHDFINGKDKTDGVWTVESIDFGEADPPFATIRHPINLRDFGLTEKREKELKEGGCWVDPAIVTAHKPVPYHEPGMPHERIPGTRISLSVSRMSPLGYMEFRMHNYYGYTIENGKIVKEKNTPPEMLTEKHLRKVLVHATVEAQQLSKFLPQLYAEYHNKPDDVL